MNKPLAFLFVIIISSLLYVYFFKAKSVTTINYFPIDDSILFTESTTNISLNPETNTLLWSVQSNSSEPVYLRQDVSLLYKNGKFKGVLNQWKENVNSLLTEKEFPEIGNNLYESISFHHGEIHYYQDEITSIQQMSNNYLYVYTTDQNIVSSFKEPTSEIQTAIKKKVSNTSKRQLLFHWNQLIDYYQIDESNYTSVPLNQLVIFEKQNIPSLSDEETKRVIGQLWEGLYKNYIIHISDENSHETTHFMPLIMIDNNHTHILVLFELNGEKMKLKQLL